MIIFLGHVTWNFNRDLYEAYEIIDQSVTMTTLLRIRLTKNLRMIFINR